MPSLLGSKPNQVSTNGDLGTLAFQDSNAVNISGGVVDVSAGTAALPTLGTTGDPDTGVFFPAANTVAVSTGGSERVRVDSSGNVGIGVTPSAWYATNTKALQVGGSSSLNDYSSSGNRQTTLANNAYLNASAAWTYSNTDPASRFHQTGGGFYWYTAPSGTAGNTITFTQAMTLNTNGALVLQGGNTSASGVGVAFPASQSASSDANTLDDYEEGTWTPTSGVGSATLASGIYTKVGRTVTVIGTLTFPVQTNAGLATITGLPFTAGATGSAGSLRFTDFGSAFFLYGDASASTIGCYSTAGVGQTYTTFSGKRVDFAMTYFV
jgi:hypothetical protein